MCLVSVTSRELKPEAKGIGYKVMYSHWKYPERYQFMCFGRNRYVKAGQKLRADNGVARGTSFVNEYERGFHIFTKRSDALDHCRYGWSDEVVKVSWSREVARGINLTNLSNSGECVVAKYMTILPRKSNKKIVVKKGKK